MTIKEVIVVEGNHDLAKLKQIDRSLDVITTNGAEIKEETLELLKRLNQERGLILMLDPDAPGEKIRRTINNYVGKTKHVFIDKKDCIDSVKQKVGIEHADISVLKTALKQYIIVPKTNDNYWNLSRLMTYRLAGTKNAKDNRLKLTQSLHIGHCNAKTLIERLNMLSITEADVCEVIK